MMLVVTHILVLHLHQVINWQLGSDCLPLNARLLLNHLSGRWGLVRQIELLILNEKQITTLYRFLDLLGTLALTD